MDKSRILNLLKSPIAFRWFLFRRLPVAFFSGINLQSIDEAQCTTSISYGFLTKNPFRSIYFASLSMAAELSTGLPAFVEIRATPESIAMLLINMEVQFEKKAVGRIDFQCTEIPSISAAIMRASQQEAPVTIKAKTTGRDKKGDVVAVFFFTWSFKRRSKRQKV